ncbi:MAG: NUDIX domain-containing protein [Bacteroidia bacterium]
MKIFLSNKIVHLINDQKLFNSKEKSVLEKIDSAEDMRLKYNNAVDKNNITELYFFNKDEQKLLDYFTGMFKVINAAGGFVQNDKNEWLFIFRNGKWDLPKGKVEKNEAIKSAAIREVEEECGVSGLTIIKELTVTHHVYSLNGKSHLKRTYWFEMSCVDNKILIPQLEEGIIDAKWFKKANFSTVLKNTFVSIKEVIKYQL